MMKIKIEFKDKNKPIKIVNNVTEILASNDETVILATTEGTREYDGVFCTRVYDVKTEPKNKIKHLIKLLQDLDPDNEIEITCRGKEGDSMLYYLNIYGEENICED